VSDQIPDDYVERLKLRDSRFAVLAEAIAVETEMRDSAVIKNLMAAARSDADHAMEALTEISPLNHESIALQLVKISTLVYIRRTLNTILRMGLAAEQAIRAEDQIEGG
jgi:hypothetical protein